MTLLSTLNANLANEFRGQYAREDRPRPYTGPLINGRPPEVVFTASGTEANNAVFVADWDTVFVAGIEHGLLALAAAALGAAPSAADEPGHTASGD